jgi:hypothetical protein
MASCKYSKNWACRSWKNYLKNNHYNDFSCYAWIYYQKNDGIDIVLKGKTRGITINIVHHFNH